MARQKRRNVTAWALLSIFVSMILLCGLHRHHEVVNPAADCVECAHHVHHSGHFSIADDGVHDCVLCQFIGLGYLLAEVLVVVDPVALVVTAWRRGNSCVISCVCRQNASRASPFILFT